MTRHGLAKNIGKLLGFCLIIFTVASCTKDYFVDETNFRLYVPQIKNNEITNFYVAFHDQTGKQVYTRVLDAPFDKDDLMKEGILRFKLYPGEYTVSCFADFVPGSLTNGNTKYSDCSLSYFRVSGQTDIFQAETANTRALFTTATALPLGNPASQTPVEINIDEDKCFMGHVGTKFINLPELVTRIDIFYSGIATRLRFGGAFDRFTVNDVIYKSINTADYKTGNTVNYSNLIDPSSEIVLGIVNPNRGGLNDPKEVGLKVNFYNGTQLVGTATYPNSEVDVPATHYDGSPVADLVLDPKATINFTFQGFTVIEVKLISWGDITGGGITDL